ASTTLPRSGKPRARPPAAPETSIRRDCQPFRRGLPSPRIRMENRVTATPYDIDLDRNQANFQPLTPIGFLERAAAVFPSHPAIIHAGTTTDYQTYWSRTRRLASALARRGIGRGDTVSTMLANSPSMLECHYGVPMTGGVLNTLNTRLDPTVLA